MGIEAILIPIMVVVIPALIVYTQIPTQIGLLSGAIIGIIIGVSAECLPSWTITLAIIALASVIFISVRGEHEHE